MIGLIAGGGKLPVMFAEKASSKGEELVIVGVNGLADPALRKFAAQYSDGNIFRLGKIIKTFKRAGVKKAAMLGRLEKIDLFSAFRPDFRTLRLVLSARDWRDTDAYIFLNKGIFFYIREIWEY